MNVKKYEAGIMLCKMLSMKLMFGVISVSPSLGFTCLVYRCLISGEKPS
jgi:hypothetical protein